MIVIHSEVFCRAGIDGVRRLVILALWSCGVILRKLGLWLPCGSIYNSRESDFHLFPRPILLQRRVW